MKANSFISKSERRTICIFVYHYVLNTSEQLLPELLGNLEVFLHPSWPSEGRELEKTRFSFGARYLYILQCHREGQEETSSKALALLLEPVLTLSDFLGSLKPSCLPPQQLKRRTSGGFIRDTTPHHQTVAWDVARVAFPKYHSPAVQKHSKLLITLQEWLSIDTAASSDGELLRQTSQANFGT